MLSKSGKEIGSSGPLRHHRSSKGLHASAVLFDFGSLQYQLTYTNRVLTMEARRLFATAHAVIAVNLIFLALTSAGQMRPNSTMQTLATTNAVARSLWLALLLAAIASVAVGQSTDVAWPSPVRTNEVRGAIPARDLGDPRVTDHFYAFTGTPGDVLITVDSRNLNGDIDVFTAANLRPLLKFTVYAGSSSPITKSIYLRKQEDLVLRVEGRTPNDDEALYRLHFGGAFEPITAGPLAEHEDALVAAIAAADSSDGGRRVSSVGARIDEPRLEVAETPKPEPTPRTSPKSEAITVAVKPTPKYTRPRRPVSRRTRPTAAPKTVEAPKPDEAAAKTETEEKGTAESSETEKPTAVERPTSKGRSSRAAKKTPPAQEPDNGGPRLLIETSDGTLVDRSMGELRRVTVENGQVVVVGKDGKIQRIPLASVVRMTISQ